MPLLPTPNEYYVRTFIRNVRVRRIGFCEEERESMWWLLVILYFLNSSSVSYKSDDFDVLLVSLLYWEGKKKRILLLDRPRRVPCSSCGCDWTCVYYSIYDGCSFLCVCVCTMHDVDSSLVLLVVGKQCSHVILVAVVVTGEWIEIPGCLRVCM